MRLFIFFILITSISTFFAQEADRGADFNNFPERLSTGIYKMIGEKDGKIYALSGVLVEKTVTSNQFPNNPGVISRFEMTQKSIVLMGPEKLFTDGNGLSENTFLNVFDAESKDFIAQHKIKIPDEIKKKDTVGLLSIGIFNNKILLISGRFNKSTKSYNIKGYELNEKGESIKDQDLMSFPKLPLIKQGAGFLDDKMECLYSPDSSKFILYHSYFKSGGILEVQAATFTSEFEPLSPSKVIEFESSSLKNMEHSKVIMTVSNDGDWGYFGRVWKGSGRSAIQSFEWGSYDHTGKLLSKKSKEMDRSQLFLPKKFIMTSESMRTFKISGVYYDNVKNKIKPGEEEKVEFTGTAFTPVNLSSGVWTAYLVKEGNGAIDFDGLAFSSVIPNFNKGIAVIKDVISYNQGFSILVNKLYDSGTSSHYYILRFDAKGEFIKSQDFYISDLYGNNFLLARSGQFTDRVALDRYVTLFKFGGSDCILRSVENSDQLEFIGVDILERDNSLSDFPAGNVSVSKIGLVKVVIALVGERSRVVVDNNPQEDYLLSGTHLKMKDGSIVFMSKEQIGDFGNLVTIIP